MTVILCGPPCSGKTTYAHAQGGTVLDWDDVFEEITGLPRYTNVMTYPRVEATFQQRARARPDWIIRTAPTKQHRAMLRRVYRASSLVLLTPPDECIRRMQADRPERTWPSTQAAILRWWRDYQPSTSPDERVVSLPPIPSSPV